MIGSYWQSRHQPRSADDADSTDRKFRPDVEGLRALAIALVVLYHASLGHFPGGFVGVDVFFVISGFLITGLLVGERVESGSISVLRFYARRARRILPALSVVLILTLFASYHWLGYIEGAQVASDVRWTAIFAANIHFAQQGTQYLASQGPVSPLLNMWSLGVEEQFYLVWPAFMILVAALWPRFEVRAKVTAALLVIIVGSFTWSIIQTAHNPVWAYYSPLTRAWELAIGGLLAVLGPSLRKIPRQLAVAAGLIGLASIFASAIVLTDQTPYPGMAAAWPVLGTAAVIAAGSSATRLPAERALSLGPVQWLGARSYSLYLWHWPLLIIAAESASSSLNVWDRLGLVGLAIVISALSYQFIERPIRSAPKLTARPALSAVGGLALVGACLVTTNVSAAELGPNTAQLTRATQSDYGRLLTLKKLEAEIVAGTHLKSVPANLYPSLTVASRDLVLPKSLSPCFDRVYSSVRAPLCVYGANPKAPRMVLFGDSHSEMWGQAVADIANRTGYQLAYFGRPNCPAPSVTFWYNAEGQADYHCDTWRKAAIAEINKWDPSVVIVTSADLRPHTAHDRLMSQTTYANGLVTTLKALTRQGRRLIVIGDMAYPNANGGPVCLAAHLNSVQACTTPLSQAVVPADQAAVEGAAKRAGALFVDIVPWLCTSTLCPPIIGNLDVYQGTFHITTDYGVYLNNLLQVAMKINHAWASPKL